MTNQPDNPKQPQGSEPLEDFFKSTTPSSAPGQGGSTPYTPPAYVPPPAQPGQRRGPSPILLIILGVLIGFVCICGGCFALTGGSIFAVLSNPTVQAGISTAQVAFGTGAAMAGAPAALPPDSTQKGALTLGQQGSAQLNATERQVWTFNGKNGATGTITATAQDKNLLLVIGLYKPDGSLLTSTPALNLSGLSGNVTLSYTLPADGTYSILVYGLGGTANSNGAYSIVVQ